MFNPLDERYRWCVYCKADCWPEIENQQHDSTCPFETGLFPVDQDTVDHKGCCGQCALPFELGEFEMNLNTRTGKIARRFESDECYEVICVGCATAIDVLGVKYEK